MFGHWVLILKRIHCMGVEPLCLVPLQQSFRIWITSGKLILDLNAASVIRTIPCQVSTFCNHQKGLSKWFIIPYLGEKIEHLTSIRSVGFAKVATANNLTSDLNRYRISSPDWLGAPSSWFIPMCWSAHNCNG